MHIFPISLTVFALGAAHLLGGTILVGPGNPGSFSPIAQVSYSDNGTPVVQTSSQGASVYNQRSTPVNLNSVTLQNGTQLGVYNFGGLEVRLRNLAAVQPEGIGVIKSDGALIPINDENGTGEFVDAMGEMLLSTDLNNYLYYDAVSPSPAAGTPDFDIQFRFAFESGDYILVEERNGNTFFELVPLDIDGNPIAGANTLRFGENAGPRLSVYDWNSGFSSASYQPSQTYAFTVTQASTFFDGTSVAPQAIFGFQIDNDGQADVKFFGLSDNTFYDNPMDPRISGLTAVPEPGVFALLLLVSPGLLLRRRR